MSFNSWSPQRIPFIETFNLISRYRCCTQHTNNRKNKKFSFFLICHRQRKCNNKLTASQTSIQLTGYENETFHKKKKFLYQIWMPLSLLRKVSRSTLRVFNIGIAEKFTQKPLIPVDIWDKWITVFRTAIQYLDVYTIHTLERFNELPNRPIQIISYNKIYSLSFLIVTLILIEWNQILFFFSFLRDDGDGILPYIRNF